MTPDRPRLGHAKVVLVPDGAHKEHAVVSTIIARAVVGRSAERITFSGPLAFERRAAAHIRQTVVPVADAILCHLGVSPPGLEVSIANLGATAVAELDSQVSGFSADLPTLLSFLSAALGMPVPDDIICTGHIASPTGEIRAVKAVPAKLRAAITDASLRRFVHPSFRNDTSLTTLTPKEAERAEAAVLEARDRIRTIAVCDVGDLVRAVFEEEHALIASMSTGYFAKPVHDAWANHPTGRASLFFMVDSDARFWACVERNLLAGTIETAKRLLDAYIGLHLGRRLYPEAFGRRLMLLLRSLPPADRRLRNMFPLIATGDCIKLSQFASTTDHEDVPLLLDAASGRHISWSPLDRGCDHAVPVGPRSSEPTAVDTVVSRLRAEYLAGHIGLPIDNARATYISETATIESKDAFNEVITAFYLHLVPVRSIPTSARVFVRSTVTASAGRAGGHARVCGAFGHGPGRVHAAAIVDRNRLAGNANSARASSHAGFLRRTAQHARL